MIQDDDVQLMQQLVDLALGKDGYTYPMLANMPKPTPPFVSVRKVSEESPGYDSTSRDENLQTQEITVETQSVRLLDFELLFTEGHVDSLRLISTFSDDRVLQFMEVNGFAILSHEDVYNNTLALQTNWEVRNGLYIQALRNRKVTHVTPFEMISNAIVPTTEL